MENPLREIASSMPPRKPGKVLSKYGGSFIVQN